jgi:hypothetical protein
MGITPKEIPGRASPGINEKEITRRLQLMPKALNLQNI